MGNKDDSVTAGTASVAGSDACHGIINTLKRYGRSLTTTATMGSSQGNLGAPNSVLNATLGLCYDDRLAPHYWERATWIFNARMQCNTTNNQGTGFGTSNSGSSANMLSVGDRIIWGRPWIQYDMSPAQFGTTNGPQAGEQLVVAADLSRYLLAFAGNGISVTRLNETFAPTNEAAFIVSVRCAGALTDVNAAFGIHRG